MKNINPEFRLNANFELRVVIRPQDYQWVPSPMPGVERISTIEPQGGPPGREIDIRIRGADATILKQAALATRDLLERYPGVRDVEDDLPYGKREMILQLTDRGRAMGFTTESVSRQVRNSAQGAIAKRFPRDDEEVDIVVKLPAGQFNMEALRETYLRNPQSGHGPARGRAGSRTLAQAGAQRRQTGVVSV